MKVLFDARCIQDRYPGVGRYAYDLLCTVVEASPDSRFGVLVNPTATNSRFPLREALGNRDNVEFIPTRIEPATLAEQVWPRLLRRFPADLYHVPFYLYPYLGPVPTVTTICDLIPLRQPETAGWRRLVYRMAIRLALKNCRRVVTISEVSRKELSRFGRLDPGKISVVYPPVRLGETSEEDGQRILESYGLEGVGYLLYVGSDKPHKNLSRLLQAWSRVRNRGGTILALGGFWKSSGRAATEAQCRRLGISESVKVLGPLPERHLSALYGQSRAFVFPSLQEGFGLPVLEAMACGAPVLCSKVPSLSEVVGEAALQIDPLDVEGWADGLERMLLEPILRQALKEKGLARARFFSRDLSASQLRDCYTRAIDNL